MSITGTNNPFSCDPVVFANANTIISLGTITRAGNVFTFSVGFVWKINGVTYQNTAPVELTIAEATEGFNRIDNALLNTSNTIELQQGLESDTIALRPVAPDTNIILTTWNISGETIGEAVAPTSDRNKEDKVSGVIAFGTNDYTATVPEVTELVTGLKILVTFENPNTSVSRMNLNGLSDEPIVKNYNTPVGAGDLTGTMILMYSLDKWVVVGAIGGSGGGGASSWGSISGTLSAQTDLQTALNGKQATLNETNFGSFSNALTEKTTLVDADVTNLVDSADSNKAKKVTWLNVWNYIKAKAEALFQKKATATTGNTIQFDCDRIYNSIVSPTTGAMTNNLTGAQIGVIQKIYYNHSTVNPFPVGWVRLGSKAYTPSALNIIYCEWVGASRVEYWISQEV